MLEFGPEKAAEYLYVMLYFILSCVFQKYGSQGPNAFMARLASAFEIDKADVQYNRHDRTGNRHLLPLDMYLCNQVTGEYVHVCCET